MLTASSSDLDKAMDPCCKGISLPWGESSLFLHHVQVTVRFGEKRPSQDEEHR